MQHGDREPRRGVVLGRAAAAGVVGGGSLGALVILPDVLEYLRAAEPDVAYTIGPSGLLLGAGFGAGVGLVSAVVAAVFPTGSFNLIVAAFALVAGLLAAALAPRIGYRPAGRGAS